MPELQKLSETTTAATPIVENDTTQSTMNETSEFTSTAQSSTRKKTLIKILSVVLVVLLIVGSLAGAGALYAFNAYKQLNPIAQETMTDAKMIVTSIQNKNLVEAKNNLAKTKEGVKKLQDEISRYGYLKAVPFVSAYFGDVQSGLNAAMAGTEAGDVFVAAIEPYADLLGLQANGQTQIKAESAEDRIVFLVQTLDAIAPKLDEISAKLAKADAELNKIDPKRYPTEVKGVKVREKIILAQSSLKSAAGSLSEAKPLIALLPELLGQNEEKLYMLLFQNDAELRPTGGFMTAYAYIKISKGKITPQDSFDIYDLDARWGKKLPAPEPIKKYLPLVNNWNLRDMNLSPDFKSSMETFLSHYRDIPRVPVVDGIIAIDTNVPVSILKIIGPVGVGGWGNFTAENDKRCDCPSVVYVLEDMITKPVAGIRTDRKAVLGPLMHSLLANAMGSPKSLWPQLLNSGLAAIKEKHILFYFPDDKNQKLAEEMNAAGRILDSEGDYLHINDTNFGGAKSNLFITQKVDEEIEVGQDGSVTKSITITYNNPAPASNCNLEAGKLCLNGVYRDWVRIMVPKGSELVQAVGSEVEVLTKEDLGKTVFEGFFTMRPQSSSKLVFKYKLPMKMTGAYKYFIQKQPGKDTVIHDIVINGKPHTVEVASDAKLTF
jgi:hypothetical protein